MAGPLGIFRKYQKVLLVVFGVLLMIVFTVGGLVNSYLGSNKAAAAQNQVVLSWKGGELRDNELQIMRYTRNQLRQFQAYVVQTAEQRGATPRAANIPNTDSEESLLQTMLLSQKAREMGIVVNDESVIQYLMQLCEKTIEPNELASLLRAATGGRMSQPQLFEALRSELLAQSVQEAAIGSVFPATPGASFDYFSRLQRRVEAEVMPLPVVDFVDQVKEQPTESEITQLYGEYKDTFSNPASPDPGFKRRKRAAFQYVKADFQDFLDRAVASLSEDEIEAYYEKNKDTFRKLDLPSDGDIDAETTGDGKKDTVDDLNSDSTGEIDLPAEPESSDLDLDGPAGETNAGDKQSPSEETATEDSESGQDESSDVGTGADESGGDDNTGGTDEGDTPVEFELEETTDSPQSNEQTESESSVEEDFPQQTEASDDQADDTRGPDPLGDSDLQTKSEDTPEEEPQSAETQSAETQSAETESAKEQIQYKPLEEVRDEITMALGRPKAQEAIEAAIGSVTSRRKTYYEQYVHWEALSDSDDTTPRPTPPDLNQLAAEYHLTAGETPLVDALGVSEYEIGTAYDLNFAGGRINRIPFAAIAFSDQVRLFQPQEISASDVDSKFLYWKTKEESEFTPSLEQARDDVMSGVEAAESSRTGKTTSRKVCQASPRKPAITHQRLRQRPRSDRDRHGRVYLDELRQFVDGFRHPANQRSTRRRISGRRFHARCLRAGTWWCHGNYQLPAIHGLRRVCQIVDGQPKRVAGAVLGFGAHDARFVHGSSGQSADCVGVVPEPGGRIRSRLETRSAAG